MDTLIDSYMDVMMDCYQLWNNKPFRDHVNF